jgi:hypothetical protein
MTALIGRNIAGCRSSLERMERDITGVSVSAMKSESSTEPAIVKANCQPS